ncbi:hypothetical protein ACFL6U_18880 [Planctomycetota bacterium]
MTSFITVLIVIPTFILETVLYLQNKTTPLAKLQKTITNYLKIEDLIGYSLVITCRKKNNSKLGGYIVGALLILGFIIIYVFWQGATYLILEEEGIAWTERAFSIKYAWFPLLVIIVSCSFYHSFVIQCKNDLRIKIYYMCLSKSMGLSFLSVTCLAKPFKQKTPRITANTDFVIPLNEIGEIEFESVGKEGVCVGPEYYLKKHDMCIYAPADWKDKIEELILNIDSLREPTMDSK